MLIHVLITSCNNTHMRSHIVSLPGQSISSSTSAMAASMLLQRGGDHALDDENDSIATSLFVEVCDIIFSCHIHFYHDFSAILCSYSLP